MFGRARITSETPMVSSAIVRERERSVYSKSTVDTNYVKGFSTRVPRARTVREISRTTTTRRESLRVVTPSRVMLPYPVTNPRRWRVCTTGRKKQTAALAVCVQRSGPKLSVRFSNFRPRRNYNIVFASFGRFIRSRFPRDHLLIHPTVGKGIRIVVRNLGAK